MFPLLITIISCVVFICCMGAIITTTGILLWLHFGSRSQGPHVRGHTLAAVLPLPLRPHCRGRTPGQDNLRPSSLPLSADAPQIDIKKVWKVGGGLFWLNETNVKMCANVPCFIGLRLRSPLVLFLPMTIDSLHYFSRSFLFETRKGKT